MNVVALRLSFISNGFTSTDCSISAVEPVQVYKTTINFSRVTVSFRISAFCLRRHPKAPVAATACRRREGREGQLASERRRERTASRGRRRLADSRALRDGRGQRVHQVGGPAEWRNEAGLQGRARRTRTQHTARRFQQTRSVRDRVA